MANFFISGPKSGAKCYLLLFIRKWWLCLFHLYLRIFLEKQMISKHICVRSTLLLIRESYTRLFPTFNMIIILDKFVQSTEITVRHATQIPFEVYLLAVKMKREWKPPDICAVHWSNYFVIDKACSDSLYDLHDKGFEIKYEEDSQHDATHKAFYWIL